MAEYIEDLNALVAEYESRGEEIWLSYAELAHPTVDDFTAMMETEAAFRAEVAAATHSLDAPTAIAAEHNRFAAWTDGLQAADEALARRAATAESWDEVEASPEFEALETLLQDGAELCVDLDERLEADDTAELFEGIPWVPRDLDDAVDALLGCGTIPTDLAAALGR